MFTLWLHQNNYPKDYGFLGDTIFNVIKLAEGLIEDERPVYPYKIIKAEVLNNPFLDIEPRVKIVQTKEKKQKENKIGVK